MPKINREEYDVLKDRIVEEIYSWDGAESGRGDDAVENVLEILDDFFSWNKSVKYEREEVEVEQD